MNQNQLYSHHGQSVRVSVSQSQSRYPRTKRGPMPDAAGEIQGFQGAGTGPGTVVGEAERPSLTGRGGIVRCNGGPSVGLGIYTYCDTTDHY